MTMDNFKDFQEYLLSGSELDEGLTLQEQYDELMKDMEKFKVIDYVAKLDPYANFPELRPAPQPRTWKSDLKDLFRPRTTTSPTVWIDARANQTSGDLQLPKWKQ